MPVLYTSGNLNFKVRLYILTDRYIYRSVVNWVHWVCMNGEKDIICWSPQLYPTIKS